MPHPQKTKLKNRTWSKTSLRHPRSSKPQVPLWSKSINNCRPSYRACIKKEIGSQQPSPQVNEQQESAPAAEIRQQLAVLRAKIQSMQPSLPNFNTSNQLHSANQSQPNPPPCSIIQPTFDTPYTSPQTHRTIDSKSPLSKGIQSSPWPPSYKPITLPKFNGGSDPRQFIMSFEAAVASASGNEAVLAKSFIIAAEGDALA